MKSNFKNRFVYLSTLTVFLFMGCDTETTHQLTTSVVGNGSVNPSSGQFDEGESVTIYSFPDSGWVFSNWEGDLTSSQTPATITMDSDKRIIAVFERKEYTLNITIEGEGFVSESILSQPKVTDYPYQTVVELTSIPSEGWEFVEWSGDLNGTESVIEVTVKDEINIIATFQRKDYSLNLTIEGQGTVTESIVSQSKVTDYPYQTVVELTAIPSEGWEFVEWSGDLNGTENPIQINIEGNTNVVAVFRNPSFYLNENGVTVMCPGANIGEIGLINGKEYISVDKEILMSKVNLIKDRNTNADLSNICTSNITDMSLVFFGVRYINQDISSWDVSNVITMSQMFANFAIQYSNDYYLGDLTNWDVSNVTNMFEMVHNSGFNQDISSWNVSNVTNMYKMFRGSSFNQDISNWDVSNVTNMYEMFHMAREFNQDISSWDVNNVTTMEGMFNVAVAFNQDISSWDVSNVTNMDYMFQSARSFNQDISNWDVSNVQRMYYMFNDAKDFSQDLRTWCVVKVYPKPTGFDTGSSLTDNQLPYWGVIVATCRSN